MTIGHFQRFVAPQKTYIISKHLLFFYSSYSHLPLTTGATSTIKSLNSPYFIRQTLKMSEPQVKTICLNSWFYTNREDFFNIRSPMGSMMTDKYKHYPEKNRRTWMKNAIPLKTCLVSTPHKASPRNEVVISGFKFTRVGKCPKCGLKNCICRYQWSFSLEWKVKKEHMHARVAGSRVIFSNLYLNTLDWTRMLENEKPQQEKCCQLMDTITID